MQKTYVRFENNTTDKNSLTLISMLKDSQTRRVVFFASPRTRDDKDTTINELNLPVLAALVEYEVAQVVDLSIVFDGLFLTTMRSPRYGEVKVVLDAAVVSGKAVFASVEAPFTHLLPPREAVQKLLEIGPVVPLDASTRAKYFTQLSVVSEASISGP